MAKMKVFKIQHKDNGVGDAIAFASETGVVDIANKCLLFGAKSEKHRITFGLVQSLEKAIEFLKEEGYIIEEQTDVEWNDTYITFTQGV